ncbi:MarR family transcriptional regulator [Aurantiacibacter xanthus]|uniref:MarR family transcriptional regulator n=2 Tax=Aurantiacibacter xanthus TaxID=1784712 RepID=A0A3A1P230_9SPHN|nr:MarR family transcriptional regulator [Aurantiacibacter xanthus]
MRRRLSGEDWGAVDASSAAAAGTVCGSVSGKCSSFARFVSNRNALARCSHMQHIARPYIEGPLQKMSDLEDLVSAYVCLYRDLMRTLDRRMAEEGMSFARTKLLIILDRRGPMRGTAIAEYLNQSPRTVTEAIDALERDGFLRRTADATDRRAKLVEITASGVEAVRKTDPLRRQIVDQTFGVLDDGERAALQQLLDKVGGALTVLRDDVG